MGIHILEKQLRVSIWGKENSCQWALVNFTTMETWFTVENGKMGFLMDGENFSLMIKVELRNLTEE